MFLEERQKRELSYFVHKYNTLIHHLPQSRPKKRNSISEKKKKTHLPSHKDHMSNPIPEIQAAYNKKKGQPQVRS